MNVVCGHSKVYRVPKKLPLGAQGGKKRGRKEAENESLRKKKRTISMNDGKTIGRCHSVCLTFCPNGGFRLT